MSTSQGFQDSTPASTPFYFNSSAHLVRITALKADTLAELLAGLQACPLESIFQHTFRTLQEHHFFSEGFSNDFAQWTLTQCNQPALSEQLASVDVRDHTSLQEFREVFAGILEKHLASHPASSSVRAAKTFYFCASDNVVIPTPFVAHSIPEFEKGLQAVSLHSVHHHFIDARLRLRPITNDFSRWLKQSCHLPRVAERIDQIDIYSVTLEDIRLQILGLLKNDSAERPSL